MPVHPRLTVGCAGMLGLTGVPPLPVHPRLTLECGMLGLIGVPPLPVHPRLTLRCDGMIAYLSYYMTCSQFSGMGLNLERVARLR